LKKSPAGRQRYNGKFRKAPRDSGQAGRRRHNGKKPENRLAVSGHNSMDGFENNLGGCDMRAAPLRIMAHTLHRNFGATLHGRGHCAMLVYWKPSMELGNRK
jgi:hypothetical protein